MEETLGGVTARRLPAVAPVAAPPRTPGRRCDFARCSVHFQVERDCFDCANESAAITLHTAQVAVCFMVK
jgi:hypothetical protein